MQVFCMLYFFYAVLDMPGVLKAGSVVRKGILSLKAILIRIACYPIIETLFVLFYEGRSVYAYILAYIFIVAKIKVKKSA